MNICIHNLYEIANKPVRKVIGLMSGTSLDGLDVVLGNISGHGLQTKFELIEFETVPYNEEIKKEIKSVFSKRQVDLEKLTLLNPWIALQHARIINELLVKWKITNEKIDLIASHGQTIYHAPKSSHKQDKFGNATLQIGDGDHLAMATGIITISDFRQKNIAAGGEGAPLAVYGDYLLFADEEENRILLNMGGIANFTFLPAGKGMAEVICTDTGPGNTLMDAYMQQEFPGKYFDSDSLVAKKGSVNNQLLNELLDHPFFQLPFPKTTGPELFNLQYLEEAMKLSDSKIISVEDCMATLNAFTVHSITKAFKDSLPGQHFTRVFMSGGGMHNPLLVDTLKKLLPEMEFYSSSNLNINPDAKEAILFALLANECICGNASFQNHKNIPAVAMGKISFPS